MENKFTTRYKCNFNYIRMYIQKQSENQQMAAMPRKTSQPNRDNVGERNSERVRQNNTKVLNFQLPLWKH